MQLPVASGALLCSLALACGSGGTPGAGGQAPVASAGAASGSGGLAGVSGGSGGAAAGTGGSASGNSGSAGTSGSAGSSAGSGSIGCSMAKTDAGVPTLLSATGCIDMADPTKPAPGLVPYSVRSPLWSDAATKERFLRIPEGTKIHALDCAVDVDDCKAPGLGGIGADEGHWIMPVGAVLVKNFSIEGKRIETRLLMRRSNLVWKGFSYEWNDAGTDATLLPDTPKGKDKPVGAGTQIWHYPSRTECLDCHTRYAGSSLGPSTAQMNSDYPYAEGPMNQVEKFKALGLFDAPPKAITGYPDPAGAESLEARARSYMHVNCSTCHRPGAAGVGTLDLRFTTPFAQTFLCDPVERDADKVKPFRLVPGDAMESTLSFRMHALDDMRMPKIGSSLEDTAGTALVDAWIDALPTDACPPPP